MNMKLLATIINQSYNDAAQPGDLYLQDSASSNYDSIIDLHDEICFWLLLISGAVFTMGFVLIYNYRHNLISSKDLTHGTLVEMIWTVTPAFVLIAVAVPSFRVLYLSDEILAPNLTVKAIGHQWYWSYSFDDFLQNINFDSYMVANDDLETGQLRMLQVDNSLTLPVGTIVRLLTVSTDVIHSFAVPSFGIKMDALPGRLNQATILINRLGSFFGQCSELCGAYHAAMPINIDAVTPEDFIGWVSGELE